MTKPEYVYSPLQKGEFRLLKLHAGDRGTEIECNLLVRTIVRNVPGSGSTPRTLDAGQSPHPEPYDALSYTWGPDTPLSSIKVIDSGESHPVSVRPNLKAALLRLRYPETPRYLWVDALCIQQSNHEEKSDQVPRMWDIYNAARSVCVWLGEEAEDSVTAMAFVGTSLKLTDFEELVENPDYSKEWAAFSYLIRRPWFSRRWIIQEIALAKTATVHCGRECVPWDDFANAISLFAYAQPKIQRLFRNSRQYHHHPDYLGDLSESAAARLVHASDNMFRKSEDGRIIDRLLPLEELMSSLSAFETTDPKDALYAILWLARDVKPGFKGAFTSPDRPLDVRSPTIFTESPFLSPVALAMPDPPDPSLPKLFPETTLRPPYNKRKASSDARSDSQILVANGQHNRQRAQSYANSLEVHLSVPIVEVSNEEPSEGSIPQASAGRNPNLAVGLHVDTTSRNNIGETNGIETIGTERLEEETTPISRMLSVSSIDRPSSARSSFDSYQGQRRGELAKRYTSTWKEKAKRKRIPVDYRKNILEVFKDVSKFIIGNSGSLDIICRPWAPLTPRDAPLPSWIPSISGNAFGLGRKGDYRRVNADPLVGKPGPGPGFYNAAKNNPARWKFKDGAGNSLIVRGFVLDTISEKNSPAIAGIIPSAWNETVGWTDMSKPPPESFWRTLVGNRDAEGQRPQRHWKKACQDSFHFRPDRGDLNVREVIMDECPTYVREYLERVQRTVWSRRLALLKRIPRSQSLCLVPSKAKKGDKVCILYGCSVPVLLREFRNGQPAVKQYECWCQRPGCECQRAQCKRVNGKGHAVDTSTVHYELLGECYVHGMMDGEALSYKSKMRIEDQDFELV